MSRNIYKFYINYSNIKYIINKSKKVLNILKIH